MIVQKNPDGDLSQILWITCKFLYVHDHFAVLFFLIAFFYYNFVLNIYCSVQ